MDNCPHLKWTVPPGFVLPKSRVMAGFGQWFTFVPSAKVKEAIQNEGGEARLSSCLVTAVRGPCLSAKKAFKSQLPLGTLLRS